ncbi:MAG: signal recognition particle-docking protein FtsY [Proteobacteria bacterium]|nr:signal recognition particle-docking protein FtsY [Pseudomonadota bacterium]
MSQENSAVCRSGQHEVRENTKDKAADGRQDVSDEALREASEKVAEAERRAKEAAAKAAAAKAEVERKAKEAEREAKEAAERKAKEEAERKAKEEAERKAKEEAERKAKEEAEHEAKEKAERKTECAEADQASKRRALNNGLEATRSKGFLAQIGKLFKGEMSSSVVDELEEVLFMADIGVQTSERLLDRVTANLKDKGDGQAAMSLLREEVRSILKSCEAPFVTEPGKPHVILTIGVNGAGKTTTLGKLAAKLTAAGKKVLLIAGDTFRAAAIEQLEEWSVRCGCEIYRSKQGADPSGTIYDGIKYAEKNGFDVALADTAGRLQNKKELIDELKKIHRVAGKALSGAPHQVLLVLDATNGQNALMQAKEFGEAIEFTGIVLTKLDGTAKGGVIIGICVEFKKPVYFIGVGEMTEDLQRFEAEEFVEALFLES